jgi:hypothetical protein
VLRQVYEVLYEDFIECKKYSHEYDARGSSASSSIPVDQQIMWHQNILATRSYAMRDCEILVGRVLHHNPDDGDLDRTKNFEKDQYCHYECNPIADKGDEELDLEIWCLLCVQTVLVPVSHSLMWSVRAISLTLS